MSLSAADLLRVKPPGVPKAELLLLNGSSVCSTQYLEYHWRRFQWTLERIRAMQARRIIEVGAHPWAMTALLVEEPGVEVLATVSAEEITNWPDDVGTQQQQHVIRTWSGKEAVITNHAVNIERTLFDVGVEADTVLACEIVEHLTRSPHVMFLNINRWLSIGGRVLLTTPNGLQFSNPLRRKPPMPPYRCNTYERHVYLFTLEDLRELMELCGFRMIEIGYCDLITRAGLSRGYDLLGRLPLRYFQDRFRKTIYVVAEKRANVRELPRCPRVYDSRGHWELIARPQR